VASTGPGEERSPAGVGGQLAQQGVLGAASDDVHDRDRVVGKPFGVRDGGGERGGEAVENAADHDLGVALGNGSPRSRLAARSVRACCRVGGRNIRSSGSIQCGAS
jgi:hypothetical protein